MQEVLKSDSPVVLMAPTQNHRQTPYQPVKPDVQIAKQEESIILSVQVLPMSVSCKVA